jgi:hypothetical protein
MKLADYLRQESLDDDAFASLSEGVFSAEAVRKWRFGVRMPRQKQLEKIVELTSGAVTANDLFAARRDESPPSEREAAA